MIRILESIDPQNEKLAKALLMESDYNISEIASIVGDESQSKFGSVFRNITGCTPSEYRKK
ncbi:MAG: helix-turn-helix domain-containing protein [Candidatus Neomarinimicrobiota bacterium]